MTLQGSLSHERYCAELLAEAEAFRDTVRGADLTATVPTCPDWTLADLVRHVGGAHRWAGTMVARRATEVVPPADVPGGEGPGDDPDALDRWLAEGAEETVRALREAGPEAAVWTWTPERRAGFWSRRMVHETVVHRADAALTAGVPFEVAPEVAADCLEEWFQLGEVPEVAARLAAREGLESPFAPGRSVHLHATDAPPELNAEWFLDLSGDHVVHRRAHEKATVAVRGPLTDLLQIAFQRLPADSDRVEVIGDRDVLDGWLAYATFG
ncbi:maleylpyruvate isomerase family mycothiol-dependent enzyme [Streptomyces sp. NBC_01525]|uniref:Maleylpyruvate isomerase family mycothiol-dependent enzyme n=1 Tax=Streptomyces benahoarensis TaxID=2595054 RepID=A0A553Z1V0_9ACTN|nr:maleylpyruvate isomerase family mycothiol-dependent enzyme [Streptomyces benahoarensis]TSB18231.1 maleylpyruvate isomerase family mycothiol-dependent enzyme [Streptomyces benahoarensis]TSB35411.1 maleylpyruvate isomerase family mycothiol-dependent enzyme [Streptomyces benahoarensis]